MMAPPACNRISKPISSGIGQCRITETLHLRMGLS
jgi:hypothetical protein